MWSSGGILAIGQVVNRSPDSARRAVEFIGQGEPAASLSGVGPDDWLLLGLPESSLAKTAKRLGRVAADKPALAFHLSGSEDASVLAPLGVPSASIHPLRPFHDPEEVIGSFSGTWCVAEGDGAALDAILPVFQGIGGNVLRAGALDKRLYHAAGVVAGNYLVTLHHLALELAEAAGLERESAGKMLATLQGRTLNAIFDKGAAGALTGPVERGDEQACRELVRAVDRARPDLGPVFRALGRETVKLAASNRPEDPGLASLEAVFADPDKPTSP